MSLFIKQRALMRESAGAPHVYTVHFSDPLSAIGVREDQARGLRMNISTDGLAVRNDFDRIAIFQRPIFNATWNAFLKRWEDLVPQGATDFSWSPTAKNREVVYRCRPFWYRLEIAENAAVRRVSVADRPVDGFLLAPMFKNGVDAVYRPVFEMTVDANGIPHSRAEGTPMMGSPDDVIATARQYDTAARTESVRDWFSDMLLQLVEFGRWNVGELMDGNRGSLTRTGGAAIDAKASVCDFGNGYGCIWRGKENPLKNVNSCLCDLLGKATFTESNDVSAMLYYLPDPTKYTGAINEHYLPLGEYVAHRPRGQSMVGGWGYSPHGVLWPSVTVGEETVFTSYAYLAASSALSAEEKPLYVGVGGVSSTAMLPASLPSSPFHWEVSQLGIARGSVFGGRLVLDEA